MTIDRIEELVFGVTDVLECARFYEDFGLEPVDVSEDRATLRTMVNQRIHLRRADDPSLPPFLAPPKNNGSGLRAVTWGVDSQESLDGLAANLATDREVRQDLDGSIHTFDETGYAIGFAVKDAVDVAFEARAGNVTGSVSRWNAELTGYGRARPIRVCHLALDIPKDGREKALAFYTERLNFRPVDIVLRLGTFLQAEGDWDQHNFLLMHRGDCYGINHAAYECRDFDEVIEGGNYMLGKGWKEARYVGRHSFGSNIYRFFYTPSGGRVEYVCDMTRVDESYETPRIWEGDAPHHVWQLKPPRAQDGPRMDDELKSSTGSAAAPTLPATPGVAP
ncbi:VOC family protein [Actinoplanes subtropicus]|uniref:VOC family protein n=1 Tax=Actinoplanes subtropicus TaxID=543632 RepID=UPI0007C56434|nr:VOC family protein [Actinoplanes subtropicus]